MNPLFEKYFAGELSEAEEAALEDVLTGSLEEAWEFGHRAEELYKAYGLPDLPDPPFVRRRWFGTGGWLVILLGLLLTGAAAWWFNPQSKAQPAVAVPAKKPVVANPKAVVPPKPVPTATAVPAPPLGPPDKATGNNLRVVVKRKNPTTATVRVVDAGGTQVRLLYSGRLEVGDWAFEWDGRDGTGRLVEPGKYSIQVLTEGVTQSRDVDIH